MVRLYATEAAKRLTSIFIKKMTQAAADARSGKGPLQNEAFRADTGGALDEMFGE